MHNLAKEAYFFEYRHQEMVADLERRRQIKEALDAQRGPHILTRINDFLRSLNHIRRIHVKVTFDYKPQPETAVC